MSEFRVQKVTLGLLLFLLLSPSALLAGDAAVTVTQKDRGREIHLKIGDVLRIELPARGGTGYSWFMEAIGSPCLKLISQDTREVGERRPGGPLLQVWRFRAEQAGRRAIKMTYYRPWEGAGQAADHFVIIISIQ